MPRVARDVRHLLAFIRATPWGKPDDRRKDLAAAYERIRLVPLTRPVQKWVNNASIGLRCYHAAQFAIIYAYFDASKKRPRGEVSIRAVRHRRERDVFFGVKEQDIATWDAPLQTRDAH